MTLQAAWNPIRRDANSLQLLRTLGNLAQHDPGCLITGNKALVDRRAEEAASLIPMHQRSENEQAVAILYGNNSPGELVELANQSKSPLVSNMVAVRLLRDGHLDHVKAVLPLLPTDLQKEIGMVVAVREFDIATMRTLGADERHLPQVVDFQFGFDYVRFWVVNGQGVAPAADIDLLVDGEPVAADQVHRFGSLYQIDIRQGKPLLQLTVLAQGEELLNEVYKR